MANEWHRIRTATSGEWIAAGATAVHDAGELREVWAHNGSWLLVGRSLLTIGYMRNAWWVLEGNIIDADVINLIAEQCPPRCTAAVVLLTRILDGVGDHHE